MYHRLLLVYTVIAFHSGCDKAVPIWTRYGVDPRLRWYCTATVVLLVTFSVSFFSPSTSDNAYVIFRFRDMQHDGSACLFSLRQETTFQSDL